jgi:hypothetical protein
MAGAWIVYFYSCYRIIFELSYHTGVNDEQFSWLITGFREINGQIGKVLKFHEQNLDRGS